MDKFAHKLVRNLKSRKYKVTNIPDKVEKIGKISQDVYVRSGNDLQVEVQSIVNPSPDGVEITAAVSDATFTVSEAINHLGFGKFQLLLFLFTGLGWMTASMETFILSVLSPALQCEWGIDAYKQAFLTTAMFFGMMVSSPFWGDLSDKYGRKVAFSGSVGLLFLFGGVSSFSLGYMWLVFFRCLVGVAIGGSFQSITLLAEFLPTKQRATCVVLFDIFWVLGACVEVLLGLVVMPTLGWRWFLGLSALPILIFFIMCYWLPESVRFLAASGQSEKAMSILKRIAVDNDKPMLQGRLIVEETQQAERGRIRDLFMGREMRNTTLLLWFIWMLCAFCYYGVVLLSTEILGEDGKNLAPSAPSPLDLSIGQNGTSECINPEHHMLTPSDYVDLLWTTLAEFPGMFITIFVLEIIGRKTTLAAQFIIFAIIISFFCFPIENRVAKTVILFAARGVVSGVLQVSYVYTPEVYPTSIRSIGVGSCSATARFGAMITPYVAQVLYQKSILLTAAVYGIIAILAAIAVILLPIETKGKEMPDGVLKS